MTKPHYCIGIDLGTTNTTIAYIERDKTELFRLSQLIERGVIQDLPSFPSEAYILTADENATAKAEFQPPWLDLADDTSLAVGTIARNLRSRFSERVAISAKSWLAERSVDPRAAILPWGTESVRVEERVSPIIVTRELLRYIRCGWDATIGAAVGVKFRDSEVVVTVPASFDEAALALTREAVTQAGFPANTRLLEEPQAALLAWMGVDSQHQLRAHCRRADGTPYVLLVCDVGGGTTDLSLFEVYFSDQQLQVKRIRVSDHILLGGDNIDLAVAIELERRAAEAGFSLSPAQWRFLLTEARRIKEVALVESGGEEMLAVSIPGSGSSLIGGTIAISLPRAVLTDLVVEGFFPRCSAEEQLTKSNTALRQTGLHFAHDPAVTKHLAHFLTGIASAAGSHIHVDGVLFNGGTLRPQQLRGRLLDVIASWQGGVRPEELAGADVEFAVSRGAALSGYLSHRLGRHTIEAGAARALFLEVGRAGNEAEVRELVCVLPRGAEEGARFQIREPAFSARLDVPVQFQMFTSRESNAQVGEIVRYDVQYDERTFSALPPLQTLLRSGEPTQSRRKLKENVQRVVVVSELDQVGRLRLSVRLDNGPSESAQSESAPSESTRQLGELRFYVRDNEPEQSNQKLTPGSVNLEATFPGVDATIALLTRFYGTKGVAGEVPKRIFEQLETQLGLPRPEWPASLCRQLWPALYPGITRRGRSIEHEIVWLTLAGFLLRPGYGVVLDEVRIEELFELARLGLSFPKEARCQIQYWILWRRVSGGLSAVEQQRILELGRARIAKAGSELAELYRALASLERLESREKLQLVEDLLSRLRKGGTADVDFISWSLMRLLAREPLYAGRHLVLSLTTVRETVEKLLEFDLRSKSYERLRLPLLSAVQFTGDRAIDVDESLREQVLTKLEQSGVSIEQLTSARARLVRSESEQAKLFGEALPLGLMHHR